MAKLICPACGAKLPHDRHPHNVGGGELTRYRECPCGYARYEKETVEFTEFYPRCPESAPIPKPQHPGEGGGVI